MTLTYRGPPEGIDDPVIGTDTTDGTGDWEVRPESLVPEGDYGSEHRPAAGH